MRRLKMSWNPFDVFRENVEYEKFKELIENNIEMTIKFFKNKELDVKSENIKEIFEKLFKGDINYDSKEILHKIAYLASRFIKFDILLADKRIPEEVYEIHIGWFNYLFERINKYKAEFSKEVLKEFHAEYEMGDFEIYKTIVERMLFNYERADLAEILADPDLPPYLKVLEFENFYRFDYAHFFVRCEHLGNEFSKYEGANYGKKLHNIFQLDDNNERTPPEIIKKAIKKLVCTRNAISHPETAGIRLIGKDRVKIMNYNEKKREYVNCNEEMELVDFWKIYYVLTALDRGFVSAALAVDITNEFEKNKS
jgi:hypothetical protein